MLDESIRLFRQHWITFALVSAVSAHPTGLFDIWLSAAGPFTNPLTLNDLRSGRLAQASAGDLQLGALIASATLSALFLLASGPRRSPPTHHEAYLRGGEPDLVRVYRRVLRRFVAVFLGTVVYALRLSGLTAIGSFPPPFLPSSPGLGGIVPRGRPACVVVRGPGAHQEVGSNG